MDLAFPRKHPHELVLFFYPSPGLDWTHPKGLTFTTTRNSLSGRPRSIGHVSVMLRSPTDCVLTGMTQLNKHEGKKEVLLDGFGLGILLHNFVGALEKPEKLAPELVKRSKKPGWLSYLRVKLSEAHYTRLHEFVTTYEKEGYHGWYGMRNRPLYGEGGGCSAFAMSFLETAGLLSMEFHREWSRKMNIPHSLIGGPVTGKKISVIEVILRAHRWAEDHEPHEKAFFWDPDLMHAWLVRNYDREFRNPTGEYTREEWNRAIGLTLDATQAMPPDGPIFKHR